MKKEGSECTLLDGLLARISRSSGPKLRNSTLPPVFSTPAFPVFRKNGVRFTFQSMKNDSIGNGEPVIGNGEPVRGSGSLSGKGVRFTFWVE